MRKLLTIILSLPLLLTAPAFAQGDDSDVIKQMNTQWLQSYPKRDTASLSRILADDFVMISPTGKKLSKTDVLRNVLTPDQQIINVTIDSTDLQIVNNVGLLTAYTSFVMKDKEKIRKGKNCYSDVYIKRKGTWVAINAHETLLELK
ncbi:nuclear transport factor 2 family protein [Dyadobacter chenwenxiniae]|uniref:Nuclear transport factor 2 family protein n=1 Tax=Dyadobacter chenwenxiniae TaxID=2906456 RepID=A0A9X1PU74_9BACT|nr:nuclear transport factor 2 family protein [Dyadobacter chenwenxiniae]MCF0065181.1 nuclear transport factor 2 family protein [Dyadobacter chenwenxiniae]UON84550.1 nuclear transport factor 2 family protein [Dyadobacter chenwenxiniae]